MEMDGQNPIGKSHGKIPWKIYKWSIFVMFILNNPLTSISTENFIATFDCQVTIYHRGLHGIHGDFHAESWDISWEYNGHVTNNMSI
jgi:hypothetical protein